MTILSELQQTNPDVTIKTVTDPEFSQFGQVIDLPYQANLANTLETSTVIPATGNQYVRNDAQFLNDKQRQQIARDFYGEQPIEIGYCNGHSNKLNAFEFHNCSELNLAATDFVLFFAERQALVNKRLKSTEAHAFFIPAGTAIEVYPTTMHFAPCAVDSAGFKCLVVLTDGTNSPLESKRKPDELLFQRNKWLLTHPENLRMVNNGAFVGLSGTNTTINPVQENGNEAI